MIRGSRHVTSASFGRSDRQIAARRQEQRRRSARSGRDPATDAQADFGRTQPWEKLYTLDLASHLDADHPAFDLPAALRYSRNRSLALLTRDNTVPMGIARRSATSWWVNSPTTTSSSDSRSSGGRRFKARCTSSVYSSATGSTPGTSPSTVNSPPTTAGNVRRRQASTIRRRRIDVSQAFSLRPASYPPRLFQADRNVSCTKSSASCRSPTKRYAVR